ncbi:hypothetical protein AKJ16_DCAP01867 [Drosera capensis]
MLMGKNKKAGAAGKGKRILITVNVIGSAGPMRFVVDERETVRLVIDMVLRSYAREGRLPVLGSDVDGFVMFCPGAESDALSPCEAIGAKGFRTFMLCKKPQPVKSRGGDNTATGKHDTVLARRETGSWESWTNKSVSLKVAPH